MRNIKLGILSAVFALIFIFNFNAAAQIKTDRAVVSGIVKIWVAPAERVLPESVPAEMTALLEKIVADKGQGKWERWDTEVLIFRGADFKKEGAAAVIKRLTKNIKAIEWQYEEDKPESGVTIFKITDDVTGNVVVGFYIATEDGVAWAWTLVSVK